VTASSSEYRKRVYTKFGDKGETSLLYGGRVSKNNPHSEAYGITDEAVSAMGLARAEIILDSLEQGVEMPTVFILPGGSPASAGIDMARCIIRTSERRVVALRETGLLTNDLIISYLNRLGDLLFVLARYEDRELPLERATGDRS
jgi:cob(I)alamin adenosyltransferase